MVGMACCVCCCETKQNGTCCGDGEDAVCCPEGQPCQDGTCCGGECGYEWYAAGNQWVELAGDYGCADGVGLPCGCSVGYGTFVDTMARRAPVSGWICGDGWEIRPVVGDLTPCGTGLNGWYKLTYDVPFTGYLTCDEVEVEDGTIVTVPCGDWCGEPTIGEPP